jgi:hypothetical protein
MAPAQSYGLLQGVSVNVQNVRVDLIHADVLIGRGSACQIRLKDPKVSRQHARVRVVQGVVTIEDLNSAHGTLVNGIRVTSSQLSGGEEITLGDSRFRFEPAPIAAPTPQPVRPAPAPQSVTPAPIPQPPVPQPAIPQLAPEAPKPRRWLLFLIGLVIPFFLGAIGVAGLFVLGFFDEPEPPEIQEAPAAILEPTVEEESSVPQETLPFTLRPYNTETDVGLPVHSDLSAFDEAVLASGYTYAVPLVVGQDVVLDFFYCGTSEAILDEIAGAIMVSMELNGDPVPVEALRTEKIVMDTRACYTDRTVFQGLIPGEYEYVQTMTVTEQINDGWETWGPEEMVSRILIRVE